VKWLELKIKTIYKDFHRDMFDQQVKKADMCAGFTKYVRNMNSYGPRAADPLSHEELPSLGVFGFSEAPPDFIPGRGHRPIVPPLGGARDVFQKSLDELTAAA